MHIQYDLYTVSVTIILLCNSTNILHAHICTRVLVCIFALALSLSMGNFLFFYPSFCSLSFSSFYLLSPSLPPYLFSLLLFLSSSLLFPSPLLPFPFLLLSVYQSRTRAYSQEKTASSKEVIL